jgi:carbonic anhydrase/acetyltransferase-like protein (isoleucine patch superfamily)
MSIQIFKQHSPILGRDVYIDEFARVIGEVTLGDDVSVWPMAVIRADVQAITIGEGSNVQDGAILHVTHASEFVPGGYALTIGHHVTIGHNAVLHGCYISHNCLIGMHSTILDGAFLEARVMLGAGSVVPPGKHLEGGYLWLGNPVKRARALTDSENAFLDYSAKHYILLKNDYLKP